MSKLSSYSCQGQRQGQIMKVNNNYSLEERLRFSAGTRQCHFDQAFVRVENIHGISRAALQIHSDPKCLKVFLIETFYPKMEKSWLLKPVMTGVLFVLGADNNLKTEH